MGARLAEGWPEERRRRKADSYGNGVPDLAQGTYEVLYAFGNRRHQPYIARWPDGKYWVLPVFWNDVEKAWRYDGFRPYVESCGSCHVTGIRRQDTPAPDNLRELPHTSPVRYNVPRAEEGWADGASRAAPRAWSSRGGMASMRPASSSASAADSG